MPDIGPLELIIIIAIALLVFGPGKLSDIGGALGRSMREFRQGMKDDAPSNSPDAAEVDPSCEACGERYSLDAKFCVRCGTRIAA